MMLMLIIGRSRRLAARPPSPLLSRQNRQPLFPCRCATDTEAGSRLACCLLHISLFNHKSNEGWFGEWQHLLQLFVARHVGSTCPLLYKGKHNSLILEVGTSLPLFENVFRLHSAHYPIKRGSLDHLQMCHEHRGRFKSGLLPATDLSM